MSLPEPYYESPCGRAVLYLGDCLEIAPSLDGVDAVISDPPYGMDWDTKTKRFSGGHNPAQRGAGRNDGRDVEGDDETFDPAPWLDLPRVVLWGSHHYAGMDGQEVVEQALARPMRDKDSSPMPTETREGEIAFTPAPIRVRVWTGTEMVYPSAAEPVALVVEMTGEVEHVYNIQSGHRDVTTCVPMLSTGLQDAEGREVWEGDLAEWMGDVYRVRLNPAAGAILYRDGSSRYRTLWEAGRDGYRVVGNAFEGIRETA